MRFIKSLRKKILQSPEDPQLVALSNLIVSLEGDTAYDIKNLYDLDYRNFDYAIEIIKEWRLNRYTFGKAKLFDVAFQAAELGYK